MKHINVHTNRNKSRHACTTHRQSILKQSSKTKRHAAHIYCTTHQSTHLILFHKKLKKVRREFLLLRQVDSLSDAAGEINERVFRPPAVHRFVWSHQPKQHAIYCRGLSESVTKTCKTLDRSVRGNRNTLNLQKNPFTVFKPFVFILRDVRMG